MKTYGGGVNTFPSGQVQLWGGFPIQGNTVKFSLKCVHSQVAFLEHALKIHNLISKELKTLYDTAYRKKSVI